jgi:hypothetical protein
MSLHQPPPVPVPPPPPPEPRWWVSVNGQTQGPFNQAYLQPYLASGQIHSSALLCLEGNSQWLPLMSWPQFTQHVPPHAPQPPAPPPSPPQLISQPSPPIPRFSTSHSHRTVALSDSVRTATLYAKVFSPGLLLVNGCVILSLFDPNVGTILDLAFNLFLLAIEAAARGLMFVGAFQANNHPKQGIGLMWVGGWALTILLTLKLLFLTLLVLALLSSPSTGNVPAPEATSDGSPIGGLIILVSYVGELLYLIFMLAGLADFRRRNR